MRLSVLTATLNAMRHLPLLVESLRQQTDQDFEWVVIDGGSTDGTKEWLESLTDLPLMLSSESDFGIYDALNKAVKRAGGEYYLVVGADDILDPHAIENYKKLGADSGADILTAAVEFSCCMKLLRRPQGPAWLRGQMAYVTCHSVGAVFRKALHEQDAVGFYSRAYPICADQLFIKRAVQAGARVAVGDFLAGRFGAGGVSTVNIPGVLTEFFRVQLQTERIKSLQVILFILRLLKHFPKLVR